MAVSFMNWSISIVGRVLARNKVVTSVKVKVVLFKVQSISQNVLQVLILGPVMSRTQRTTICELIMP